MGYGSRRIASGNEEADAFFERLINCERLQGQEADDLSGDDQALLIRFGTLVRRRQSLSRKRLEKLWEDAKSQHGRAVSPEVEGMARKYFQSIGSNNRPDLDSFSRSILSPEEEAFLTPGPNTSDAEAFMLGQATIKCTQPRPIDHVVHRTAALASASTSTSQRHSAITRPPNQEMEALRRISPMGVVSGLIKIVEFALTVAELSSLCTIM